MLLRHVVSHTCIIQTVPFFSEDNILKFCTHMLAVVTQVPGQADLSLVVSRVDQETAYPCTTSTCR